VRPSDSDQLFISPSAEAHLYSMGPKLASLSLLLVGPSPQSAALYQLADTAGREAQGAARGGRARDASSIPWVLDGGRRRLRRRRRTKGRHVGSFGFTCWDVPSDLSMPRLADVINAVSKFVWSTSQDVPSHAWNIGLLYRSLPAVDSLLFIIVLSRSQNF
jgi:hypothetical protein